MPAAFAAVPDMENSWTARPGARPAALAPMAETSSIGGHEIPKSLRRRRQCLTAPGEERNLPMYDRFDRPYRDQTERPDHRQGGERLSSDTLPTLYQAEHCGEEGNLMHWVQHQRRRTGKEIGLQARREIPRQTDEGKPQYLLPCDGFALGERMIARTDHVYAV